MVASFPLSDLQRTAEALCELRAHAVELEAHFTEALRRVPPQLEPSARNLIHYVGVRQHDLRDLQRALHRQGLSSLGRMEAYVAATLDAVLGTLGKLTGAEIPAFPAPPVGFDEGRALLERNTVQLLGRAPAGRDVRIMVTMPQDAATDPSIIQDLLASGMNVMRINGAKDGPEAWERMLEHLQQAKRKTGNPCKVQVDLEGPNPRTGPLERKLRVEVGDRLRLEKDPAVREDPEVPAISCTLPEALDALAVGDRVSYDDGSFRGVVVETDARGVTVEIRATAKENCRVKPQKGLNFPDTDLGLPSLTARDFEVLEFAAQRADVVALSFVRTPDDVHALGQALRERKGWNTGIVLKIETRRAFEQLPRLLLAALAHPPVGVMVARGDMGVELGFERLAEAQEEVLWMCEAAHVPVIWATQVLESLAKSGMPSRAEVTDAAMSGRAECVMLNKGPYAAEAVRFLDDVLRRMQDHQHKKLTMLRKLRIADL